MLTGQTEYCLTCHVEERFCNGCHGMEMPHPEEFKTKEHPEESKKQPEKCVMCHGENEKTHFCDECHHGTKVDYEYDVKQPWVNQH
ncbi:hypothetical protein HGA89_00685, partial [bacterium]|nr:hypothetical protein [bacterium]